MITKSKIAMLLAVAALGFATPALAQSLDPSVGSGNTLPFSYAPENSGMQLRGERKLYNSTVQPNAGRLAMHAAVSASDPGIESQS